ncbi:MAG: fluoride efflux transporter CrcB [Waterburya sp.]
MQQLLMIFLGGGFGSICRYIISKLMTQQFETTFPLGTLTVNVIGSFLIGAILALIEKYQLHSLWAYLLVTGFCGGFTTFSTFAYENYLQFKTGNYSAMFSYTFMSLLWGFSATWLGFLMVKKI